MCIVSRGTPCCGFNFLFVHGSKHLWPLQSRGEIFRETERLNKTKKRLREKERGGRGENRMITKAAQISQTHISSIMWISRGDYAWRWQAGGVITIHHKGCFLISHTLISFCLQIASHSSLFFTHTHKHTESQTLHLSHSLTLARTHARTHTLLLKFQVNRIYLVTVGQPQVSDEKSSRSFSLLTGFT